MLGRKKPVSPDKSAPIVDPEINTEKYDVGDRNAPESDGEKERLLYQMRQRMIRAREFWRFNHEVSRQDLEFAYSSQWSAKDKASRKGRPMLELNAIPQYINHVKGNAIRSASSIHIAQTGGVIQSPVPNITGSKNYSKAQIVEGLVRDIESRSGLQQIGVRAVGQAADGGFSWMRVLTVENPANPFEPQIEVRGIRDRYSVLVDGNTQKDDMSDMGYAFVYTRLPKSEFETRYPGVATMMDYPSDTFPTVDNWWCDNESVVVTEYWRLHPIKRTAIEYKHQEDAAALIVWEDEVEPLKNELEQMGFAEERRKEIDTHEVRMFKTNGFDVLSDEIVWAGNTIPLVFVAGRTVDIGKQTVYLPLHHFACDAQRMHNFWMSAATERVAMTPKTKIMATADMLNGFEGDWESSFKSSKTVLYYQPDEVTGNKPEIINPPTMPTVELQLAMATKQGINDATGIYPPSLGQKSNETSGEAIKARNTQGEIGSLEFGENLLNAYKRVGEILVEIIPKCFSSAAITRIMLPDNSTDAIHLNYDVTDKESGQKIRLNNLLTARYGVRVAAGPSYETQRQESAQMMSDLARNNPEPWAIAQDLIVETSDFVGKDIIARRLKQQLPPHLLTEEERATLPPPPPPQPDPAEMLKQQNEERQKDIDGKKVGNENLKLQIQLEQLRKENQVPSEDVIEAVVARLLSEHNAQKRR